MAIEKIIGIGMVAVILSVMMKNYRPEVSVGISVITVAVLFMIITPQLKSVMVFFVDIAEKIGVEMQYIIIVIKVIGVAYLAQISAEICRDAGEGAIGTKIELGGKIIIIVLSMPVIYRLLEVVSEVINFA